MKFYEETKPVTDTEIQKITNDEIAVCKIYYPNPSYSILLASGSENELKDIYNELTNRGYSISEIFVTRLTPFMGDVVVTSMEIY